MFFVLDASAMIAYLRDEAGADTIEQALLDPGNTFFAHAINLCEMYYDFYRSDGQAGALSAVSDIKALGVVERNDFDANFWQEAGRLKAVYIRVSLADCCAIALTNRIVGTLLTSDHHELDSLAKLGVCPITFIR